MPASAGNERDDGHDRDIEKLRTANPFDRAFINAMIEHHKSAIAAAQVIKASTARTELVGLADGINAGQQREIGQMKAWRAASYP